MILLTNTKYYRTKENSLEKIFNVEGRYYILADKNFVKHNEIGVGDNEYVSSVDVDVIEEVSIPNVLDYYTELEKMENLKFVDILIDHQVIQRMIVI